MRRIVNRPWGTIDSRTMNRTVRNTVRKAKKSYTLSIESVAFLEEMRKRRRAGSISSILEEILQEVRRTHQRAALNRAVSDYYDSISDENVKEQAAWGEFALSQFGDEERS